VSLDAYQDSANSRKIEAFEPCCSGVG